MFGRMTRVVALGAVITQLWVSLIVAPWHHLVEHRLVAVPESPGAKQVVVGETEQPVRRHSCRCRHHAHRATELPVCESPVRAEESPDTPTPAAPEHHDDCLVCQILAQQFTSVELPALVLSPERMEFSPPASSVQPWLGLQMDPVSRGPPAA
jgi:hypothetical protein